MASICFSLLSLENKLLVSGQGVGGVRVGVEMGLTPSLKRSATFLRRERFLVFLAPSLLISRIGEQLDTWESFSTISSGRAQVVWGATV